MRNEPTKITYRTVGGFGELRKLVRGKKHELEITVEPKTDGYISIGQGVFKVHEGTALINLSLLDEGILSPTFAGSTRVSLEPILFDRGKLYTMPISEEALRRLLIRTEKTENMQKELTERIEKIEERLGGALLF